MPCGPVMNCSVIGSHTLGKGHTQQQQHGQGIIIADPGLVSSMSSLTQHYREADLRPQSCVKQRESERAATAWRRRYQDAMRRPTTTILPFSHHHRLWESPSVPHNCHTPHIHWPSTSCPLWLVISVILVLNCKCTFHSEQEFVAVL